MRFWPSATSMRGSTGVADYQARSFFQFMQHSIQLQVNAVVKRSDGSVRAKLSLF
jgi:hypothetical protein